MNPTLQRLDSGYWLVRWSNYRWIQWPIGSIPTVANGFGWVTQQDVEAAIELTGGE